MLVTKQAESLMKISELVAASGVSKQTIHYYLREGLLSPPVKTSRNMAYYDDRHIAEISLIKELQEKRYFPLAVIKVIMDGRREGKDMDAADHLRAIDELFVGEGPDSSERCLTQAEFINETGLTESVVEILIEQGLILPNSNMNHGLFTGNDLLLGKSFKYLLDLGLKSEDLVIYGEYLRLIRTEVSLVHDRIIDNPHKQPHPPLDDIKRGLDNIKLLLVKKAYRELILEHRHAETEEERGQDDD
ncbi:MerR family transcriptional regulator [Syntrophomonas palmitatica]|uniref:MerR family transcriptional regulator n=1 Tax=Syntrophomonas palmitatica TaxID=402877 RepID=UPI0006CF9F0B|nr:MerR family transcriptional regulator [Syntrophomonas palmitatica]